MKRIGRGRNKYEGQQNHYNLKLSLVDMLLQVLALVDMQNLMPDTVTCEMNNETFLIFGRCVKYL